MNRRQPATSQTKKRRWNRYSREQIELARLHNVEELISVTSEGEDVLDLLPGPAERPDDIAHRERVADLVRELLEKLTPKARNSLQTRYGIGGHAPVLVKDIAAARGVIRNAIVNQESRALKRLRSELSRVGIHGMADI